MVALLDAQHIDKSFGDEPVLQELSIAVQRHETLSILGRSGCGKTTLLKILAGLEQPDSGTVHLEEQDLQILKPQERDVVYLYQEALLFPHLTVFENIAFGLRLRKSSEQDIKTQVQQMITRLELEGMAPKMPHQLSGGQKQRVSFGRALITNPKVLLLDEPFGNLDADIRSNMQQLFKEIAADFEITAVFVTHNIKEAILMGDRIGTLSDGRLTLYESKEAFLRSGYNGIKEELEFWNSVINNIN